MAGYNQLHQFRTGKPAAGQYIIKANPFGTGKLNHADSGLYLVY